MRIIIKDADFSAVSIGKVGRDLSFDYTGEDTSWLQNSGVPASISGSIGAGAPYGGADWYTGSEGGASWTLQEDNKNRFASKPIEVRPGMRVKVSLFGNTITVPTIVALDANEVPLTPLSTTNALWQSDMNAYEFTVPEGAAYILVTASTLYDTSRVRSL